VEITEVGNVGVRCVAVLALLDVIKLVSCFFLRCSDALECVKKLCVCVVQV
jgi:hypothetical protein